MNMVGLTFHWVYLRYVRRNDIRKQSYHLYHVLQKNYILLITLFKAQKEKSFYLHG